MFTWQGAVLAATVVAFPLVYKSARAAFEGVNIQYSQAAQVLGKSEWAIFVTVSMPLAWRGILAGCLMARSSFGRVWRNSYGGREFAR